MFTVSSTSKSLRFNIKEFALNRSTIRRSRQQQRKQFATEVFQKFSPTKSVIVHWDGKLLLDLTRKQNVDRLAMLVSCQAETQLLCIPQWPSGTGEAQASAVCDAIKQWGLEKNIQVMCFDTTSSNTGRTNGACVIVEQKLGRDLTYLACRHHIMELIAGAAFKKAMSANNIKDELIRFIYTVLEQDKQPRDDYRELMEITLIFLGDITQKQIRFRAPGASPCARWMAKVVHTFKVWLFRSQFRMIHHEQNEKNIQQFCATVYLQKM